MTELQTHSTLVTATFIFAAATFFILLWVAAPYGRHLRPGWGPTISARTAWMVMESPSVLLFAAIFWAGDNARATVPLVLFSLWQLHYIYRTFVFPLRLRASGKRMPVSVVAMAIAFNCLNSYINARWISHFGDYPDTWLTTTTFLAGVVCFGFGWGINQYSDTVLIRLRQPGESGYAIPRGGLFRWVSCPNYLGEILQWFGWAIACWSMAGAAFAIFTLANLLPRAVANHRWYQKEFPDYPRSRRAVVPYWI